MEAAAGVKRAVEPGNSGDPIADRALKLYKATLADVQASPNVTVFERTVRERIAEELGKCSGDEPMPSFVLVNDVPGEVSDEVPRSRRDGLVHPSAIQNPQRAAAFVSRRPRLLVSSGWRHAQKTH